MNENDKSDESGSNQNVEGEPDPCPPGFYWDAELKRCVPIIIDEPN